MAIESPLTQTTTGCFEEPAANVTSEVREVAGRLPDNLRSKNVPCFRRGYRIEARAWLLSAALHSLSGFCRRPACHRVQQLPLRLRRRSAFPRMQIPARGRFRDPSPG